MPIDSLERHRSVLQGKRVLVRVAFDVPLQTRGKRQLVADDRRIRETIPTIKLLQQWKCKIVLLSWLGRPNGTVVETLRMKPVAKRLSELLKTPVQVIPESIGPTAEKAKKNLRAGQILMLENVRFYPGEEKNSPTFASALVRGCDAIVFDAFAQAHRDCPSITGIMKLLPSYSGLLVEREVTMLEKIVTKIKHPFVVVLGGGKTSDKIPVIQNFVKTADSILLGGGPANVFLKAAGVPVGASLIESDKKRGRQMIVVTAKRLVRKNPNVFHAPIDLVAANRFNQQAIHEVVDISRKQKVKKQWMFMDIGPKTVQAYCEQLQKAKTIFWNGPMGVYEFSAFSHGSRAVAQCIAKNRGVTIVGGGDTEAVISHAKLEKSFTHVSTGGGASLAFVAGQELPGLTTLGYVQKKN